jgi:hypothetical protein
MDYDDCFEAFYSLYRLESDIPDSDDDEYTIGMRLANEAITRWSNYDGTYWKELFTTLQTNGGGTQTITAGTTDYLAPGNFREAGGFVRVKNSDGNTVQRYPIIDPQDAQFRDDNGTYCYFTEGQNYYSTGTVSQATTTLTGSGTTFTSAMVGMKVQFDSGETATITAYTSGTNVTVSPSQTVSSTTYKIINKGWTLHLNPAPEANLDGMDIDYVYYKKPTLFTTGTSRTEMSEPYFIVHRMLANRFRGSRNPYYGSAKADAEDVLRTMQIDNNSGSWANPWHQADNSGTVWGENVGGW